MPFPKPARVALALALAALAPGCHRPLVIGHDDLLLHASPSPLPQPAELPLPAAPQEPNPGHVFNSE